MQIMAIRSQVYYIIIERFNDYNLDTLLIYGITNDTNDKEREGGVSIWGVSTCIPIK